MSPSRRSLGLILLSLPFLIHNSAGAESLRCAHLPQLFDFYLRHHYSIKSMTEPLKTHTIEQYIQGMDPSKTLLLESDVAQLKKEMGEVFTSMQSGNCDPLTKSSALLVSRAKEAEDFVRGFLGKDYKVDEATEIVIDPKKRGYAKTQEERNNTLRKMVHFQVSTLLLAELKMPDIKKQLVHRYELITKRVKERQGEDLIANYAEAFAVALDPHSSFLSRDNLEDFKIQMQLSLEGIGASLSSDDGFTIIEELIPGGSAERTKLLRPQDKIMSVAQDGGKPVSVMDMELREVVKLIRGRKGTKVKLTILRQGEKTESFDVTIVRDKIDMKEQAAKIAYETRTSGEKKLKIGVIDLPSFYGGGGKSCSTDVKKLLEDATREKVDGIVLNLSRNGGGLLDEAVKISGLFIKRGAVVATKDAQAKVQVLADDDDNVVWAGPLVVLISRLSASASEILAGALKDYKRALVVGGDHTFGKGSVQLVSDLPLGLGGMKVTTGMFFLPGGASTQHAGVSSHVRLPSVFSTDEIGENTLDYSLPPQSIPAFLSKEANGSEAPKKWVEVTDAEGTKLAEKSKERVTKDGKFADILKSIEEAQKNEGTVKLADLRKKSETEKKAGKKKAAKGAKERLAQLKDREVPFLQEGVNILVDLITMK